MMTKMNLTKHVEDLNIESGGTYRGTCPVCRGSNTFTVFNDSGRFIYNCYKLACRIKSAVNIGLTAKDIQMQMRKRGKQDVVREEIPTMEIPQYVVQPTPEMKDFHGFLNKWKVPAYGLMYDVKDSRCVFPIYKKGRIIDAIGRSLKGKMPKWYRYTGQAPAYFAGSGKTLLIVEDVLSAIIAAQEIQDVTSMAILGTSLNAKHMEYIGAYSRVLVALDPDALNKTIQYRREIALWTGLPTIAICLEDDPKYRRTNDIETIKNKCLHSK